MKFFSQITFLYFEDLTEPALFFEGTLGLEKVDDQGFAKISTNTTIRSEFASNHRSRGRIGRKARSFA